MINLSDLNNLLRNCGFSKTIQEVNLDLVLQSDAYFYADSIFNADWRSGDSIWSLVPEEILSEVLIKANKMHKEGELEAYLKHHDKNPKNYKSGYFQHFEKITSKAASTINFYILPDAINNCTEFGQYLPHHSIVS